MKQGKKKITWRENSFILYTDQAHSGAALQKNKKYKNTTKKQKQRVYKVNKQYTLFS